MVTRISLFASHTDRPLHCRQKCSVFEYLVTTDVPKLIPNTFNPRPNTRSDSLSAHDMRLVAHWDPTLHEITPASFSYCWKENPSGSTPRERSLTSDSVTKPQLRGGWSYSCGRTSGVPYRSPSVPTSLKATAG
ncbi:hypothetical protein OE88DRAFT_1666510 [Heliocybe sulcata]|uniref:Uncharacterized protein n=1 Tax=Heliocybe sulcata TaxID=5364 RepID=A0A5C3MQF8_9AGAM|nr:hypothetical protein OE88DRAFT_1666510 [Heliocybe sulcata]